MEKFNFIVDSENQGLRIDKFLSNNFSNLSRSYIQKLIEESFVVVDKEVVSKKFKILVNQNIEITIPDVKELDVKAENIPLDIVYEDNDLLIVNKPKGMVVHPAPGNFEGTLVNALLFHCKDSLSGINGIMRPGIVHRIDKNTSGLLIVAKNDNAHQNLASQIKEHSFKRHYESIVHGVINPSNGTIRTFIQRHKTDRKKMAVSMSNGKLAITHYELLKTYNEFSHVKLNLETGRTHQIRVHMKYINHHVLGDDVYGVKEKKEFSFLVGQCLHARTIGFIHPTSKKYIEFTSDLPNYFKKCLNILEKNYS